MSALRESQEIGYCGQVKQNAAGLASDGVPDPNRRTCYVPSEGLTPIMMHHSEPPVSGSR